MKERGGVMKVIFGGAFNPVTKAHMQVYEYVMSRVGADEFVFLPVSSAYTKSDLASNYHRLNMLELAIAKKDNVRVSELELNDSDFLGTYQSLIRFSDSEKVEVGFVIGADNLMGMHLWINIEGILSEFKIIVLSRYGINIHKIIDGNPILKKHKSSFIICEDFDVDISSTHFRENFKKEFVPEGVFQYIVDNGLYQVDDDERI